MGKSKIDNIGMAFRFITPVLVTVAIFILTMLLTSMKEIKSGFNNHLEHHRELEKSLEGRLSCLETIRDYIMEKEARGGD